MRDCHGILWNCTTRGAQARPAPGWPAPLPSPAELARRHPLELPSAASCSCVDVSQDDDDVVYANFHKALAYRRALSNEEKAEVEPIVVKDDSSFDADGHSTDPYWAIYLLLAHGLLHHLDIQPTAMGAKEVWMEFGVYKGRSTNITCDTLGRTSHTRASVEGFDSFEGLPTAWGHMPKGRFTLHGRLPTVRPCAKLHQGYINASSGVLPRWLAAHAAKTRLLGASIDVDLYTPAYDALISLKRAHLLQRGTLLHFHEMVASYSPADSNLWGPDVLNSKSRHVLNQLRFARRTQPPVNDKSHRTDEQRALIDVLRRSQGMSVWLVPKRFGRLPHAALLAVV